MIKKSGLKQTNTRTTPASDRELMTSIHGGDTDSFRQLYRRFSKRLQKYAFKHTRSRPTAEDLTQEIFLKIHKFKQNYNPHYEVSTWIWAIAKNTIYDYFRQTRRQKKNLKSIEEIAFNIPNDAPFVETAELLMIQKEESATFQKTFTTLSEKQREVLFHRLIKNSSYNEISRTMNISLSAVKSLINRGKATLMKAKWLIR